MRESFIYLTIESSDTFLNKNNVGLIMVDTEELTNEASEIDLVEDVEVDDDEVHFTLGDDARDYSLPDEYLSIIEKFGLAFKTSHLDGGQKIMVYKTG